MSFKNVSVLVSLLVASTQAQIPSLGRCPDVPVVTKFDLVKYLGKWYEIEKYFTIFEAGGTCITATYSDLGNGTVGVFNVMTEAVSRNRRNITGSAVLDDPASGEAKLTVTFLTMPFGVKAPYWVLDTDYGNYSVVWSCQNVASILNFQVVWYLARTPAPSEDNRKRVYSALESVGLHTSKLSKTEQTKCPETY